jgi:hypothetical protein
MRDTAGIPIGFALVAAGVVVIDPAGFQGPDAETGA